MTYTLNPVPVPGTTQIDSSNEHDLRDTERPDTLICRLTIPVGDADFWARLLRAQARKAWEEGREAGYDDAFSTVSIPTENPYSAEAQVDGL